MDRNLELSTFLVALNLPKMHWRRRFQRFLYAHPGKIWAPMVVLVVFGVLGTAQRSPALAASILGTAVLAIFIAGKIVPSRSEARFMEADHREGCRDVIWNAVIQVYEPVGQIPAYVAALEYFGLEEYDNSFW